MGGPRRRQEGGGNQADATIVVDDNDARKKGAIAGRVKQIRRQIDETASDYDREKRRERLARVPG